MAFKVHHPAGYDDFGPDATYTFNGAGLLVIHLGPTGGRLTYAPSAWTVVEEPDDDGVYLKTERFSHSR
jgi:hypothetical protein